jgi:hypothetical protein
MEAAHGDFIRANPQAPASARRQAMTLDKKAVELAKVYQGSAQSFAKQWLTKFTGSHVPTEDRIGFIDRAMGELAGANMEAFKKARKAEVMEAIDFARAKATGHLKADMAAMGITPDVGMSAIAPYVAMAGKAKAVPTITPSESPAFWDEMGTKIADKMAGTFADQLMGVLRKAGEDGVSWSEFRDSLGDRVSDGITGGRVYMNYHTLTNTAYSQFRYNAQAEVAKSVPNVQFVCMMLPTSRAEHMALNGTVVPFGSDFHLSHQTPLDYNCYCQWVPVGEDIEETKPPDLGEWKTPFGDGLPADRLAAWIDSQ